jgi:hypothetical protein
VRHFDRVDFSNLRQLTSLSLIDSKIPSFSLLSSLFNLNRLLELVRNCNCHCFNIIIITTVFRKFDGIEIMNRIK